MGSKTLKDSLQKGADQVNSIKATKKTNKMFAAPVKAKNVEYSHVDNNGHAMAPYMMSVGLFVACMAFTLMYPLMEKTKKSRVDFPVVVKQSHSYGSSIHCAGSDHGCSFNGNQWTRTTLRRKNIWNGRLSIHGIYVIDLLWRDVIKPCRKLRHVSIHGRTVRCSRRNISIGYGTTLLHSITQIYAIQLYSTRIPSHTHPWMDGSDRILQYLLES